MTPSSPLSSPTSKKKKIKNILKPTSPLNLPTPKEKMENLKILKKMKKKKLENAPDKNPEEGVVDEMIIEECIKLLEKNDEEKND
jgi:hypothetical protein